MQSPLELNMAASVCDEGNDGLEKMEVDGSVEGEPAIG
jgi:hypothetical protein